MPATIDLRSGLRIYGIFAVLVVLLVAGMANIFWPCPLFTDLRPSGSAACTARQPIVLTLTLPNEHPSCIEFWTKISNGAPLFVSAQDARTGRDIVRKSYTEGGPIFLELPRCAVTELRLSFESRAETDSIAPRLLLSKMRPRWPVKMDSAETQIPLLACFFQWPARFLLVSWLAVPILAVWVLREPKRLGVYLIFLGLCCTITSLLLWVRDYSTYYGHHDSDYYGLCARSFAAYLTRPETRTATAHFIGNYEHLPNALISVLIAPALLLGAPLDIVYPVVNALCGFAAMLFFFRILSSGLKVSIPVQLLAITLYAVHWLHVRSFAREIPDALGLLIIVAILALLSERLTTGVARAQNFWFALLLFLAPVSRPQGVVYAAFLLGAVALCDAVRERKLAILKRLRTLARIAAIPSLALFLLFWKCDLFSKFQMQIDDTRHFGEKIPHGMLVPVLIGALQGLPLVWIMARGRAWRHPVVLLLFAWASFYGLTLFVGRAPAMTRHFIPVLPCLVTFTAVAVEHCRDRLRLLAWGLSITTCAANAACLAYQIYVYDVPAMIHPYITSW